MFSSSKSFESSSSSSLTSSSPSVNVLNIVDFDAFIVEIFLNYLYTDILEVNLKNFKMNFRLCGNSDDSDDSDDSAVVIGKNKIRFDVKSNDLEDIGELNFGENENDCEEDDDLYESRSFRTELYTHLFIELFKISDKYCVHRLKQICEHHLIKLINCDTTVELLILAYLHNSLDLKKMCFNYLAKNVSIIIEQPSWLHLEKNYPALLAEAFRVLYFKQINNSECK